MVRPDSWVFLWIGWQYVSLCHIENLDLIPTCPLLLSTHGHVLKDSVELP